MHTRIVPTQDRTLYWHAKTVKFKAHSDCIVRDLYTLAPGSQVTMENGLYQQTSYVLHTGASWRGVIGKAEIAVKLAHDAQPTRIKLQRLSSLADQDLEHLKWSALPAGTVIYEGPCRAELHNSTIYFRKENFKPSGKDDIHLYYGWRPLTNVL